MLYVIITIIAISLAYYFYKGYRNTQLVTINHIKIDKNEPQANFPQLRILHISDMHLENISISPEKLYQNLKDQPVDLIALTGDFLDRKRSIPQLVPYLEVLNQLNPVYGSYAVFGNHDYVLQDKYLNELKGLLNGYGFKVMRNENESIEIDGRVLNIIGIDDNSTNRSNIKKAYEGLKQGYNLVLTHDPNVVLSMPNNHFDYLLSGHFHGGQIYWPKPYHLVKMGKLVKMKMVKGLHYHNDRPFYISEGLGQTGINIRVGSRPEITFHEINLHLEIPKKSKEAYIAG